MTAPHEAPAFRHAARYTVCLTLLVQGGARPQTAHGRAQRLAERLANTAARAAHVLEITGLVGPSRDEKIASPRRIHFAQATTGRATYGEPHKRDRYRHPGLEEALTSLEDARAADRAGRHAAPPSDLPDALSGPCPRG